MGLQNPDSPVQIWVAPPENLVLRNEVFLSSSRKQMICNSCGIDDIQQQAVDFICFLLYNHSIGGDDMNNKFSFPKRYWIYLIIVLICSILLFGNIFRTDSWTGDKPFSQFAQRDWLLFAIFLIEEIIIIGVMFLFVVLAYKIGKKQNIEVNEQWEKDKYLGIKPGDYDCVWFDFADTERALILKQEDKYKLNVQEYDEHTGNWESFSDVSIYDSLEAVIKALFYEYDFYCDENAELDGYGDEIFKET